ncbi:hypothetical protein MKY91_08680 [Alkalicoccobacillus gibsonii]|uniref:Uncharacterized protein n=1 Tax=Alkalicoccobacillus gibsonii TaxID=79881 RepID=A0ABU9VHW8_9BACI
MKNPFVFGQLKDDDSRLNELEKATDLTLFEFIQLLNDLKKSTDEK